MVYTKQRLQGFLHWAKQNPAVTRTASASAKMQARFKSLSGNPHYIALGMAIGVFAGFSPTIPFQTILALGLAFCLRGSRCAAALGVWLNNPITMPFIYISAYQVGTMILGPTEASLKPNQSLQDMLLTGRDIAAVMFTGGLVLGLAAALPVYMATRRIVARLKNSDQAQR